MQNLKRIIKLQRFAAFMSQFFNPIVVVKVGNILFYTVNISLPFYSPRSDHLYAILFTFKMFS